MAKQQLSMITPEFAQQFAHEWIAAWNSHNLDVILNHYTDDFTIESPIAATVVPESKGKLQGKQAIKAYWQTALQRIPDLKFELIDILVGMESITLYYTNTATGKKTAEVMRLNNEQKVTSVLAHYS